MLAQTAAEPESRQVLFVFYAILADRVPDADTLASNVVVADADAESAAVNIAEIYAASAADVLNAGMDAIPRVPTAEILQLRADRHIIGT